MTSPTPSVDASKLRPTVAAPSAAGPLRQTENSGNEKPQPNMASDASYPISPSPTPWGMVPPELKIVLVSERPDTGGWIRSALETDKICRVWLWCTDRPGAALEHLRLEAVDVVLIDHVSQSQTLRLLDAIRNGTEPHQPVIVLGRVADSELAIVCFEAGADAYLCRDSASARELIWHLTRAVERQRLIQENDRLKSQEKARRTIEQDQSMLLVDEQARILLSADSAKDATQETVPYHSNDWLRKTMSDLLRAYVVMGSGQLRDELDRFTDRLRITAISPHQVSNVYLATLRETIRELGQRSCRHIVNRGCLLWMELQVRLMGTKPMDPISR